jgi:triosephosphate isomerase
MNVFACVITSCMKYIFANWKSNKNVETAKEWLHEVGQIASNNEIVLCPPFTLLGAVYKQAHKQGFKLGVQDLSQYESGSYTGAISSTNIDDMDVAYAILGHSERRRYFGEQNIDVANKVERAVDSDMTPVVCVDEDYIESQANAIDSAYYKKCIIAYEPLSAIGTGDEMKPEKVVSVIERIKKAFGKVRVIYGGSVTAGNIKEYITICDGVLVGGASLNAQKFQEIVQIAR